MNEYIELECTRMKELGHATKRLKKLEHATKSMWELEFVRKRTKKLEHVAKKMKASTKEGMIIQCCMGVRCKHWVLWSSWWFVIFGLTFN
jgi:hypothetical protein